LKADWGKEEFERFLAWLDPDREQAAVRHEEVRRRLCKFFVCRCCPVAEELADETIDRVIRKGEALFTAYVGDPRAYFFGVAHRVYLEWTNRPPLLSELTTPLVRADRSGPPDSNEAEYDCLEECLRRLPQQDRDLIVEYYQDEKQAKIEHRKHLAERFGITTNTLRIRVHRIRARLQECIFSILQLRVAQP